mmetsp:Transcript_76971/g.152442  ORF Transcript_76971/g.152442 Transcript_76971/m.152442 type:complete len:126 (+) Transcript_76971:1213-1590(+)
MKGINMMPGRAPMPKIRRQERPGKAMSFRSSNVPQVYKNTMPTKGTNKVPTPCMENTRLAKRPRLSPSELSIAMVAASGYTPPTPTPRRRRVMQRKTNTLDPLDELNGTAKAEANAPKMDNTIVS